MIVTLKFKVEQIENDVDGNPQYLADTATQNDLDVGGIGATEKEAIEAFLEALKTKIQDMPTFDALGGVDE